MAKPRLSFPKWRSSVALWAAVWYPCKGCSGTLALALCSPLELSKATPFYMVAGQYGSCSFHKDDIWSSPDSGFVHSQGSISHFFIQCKLKLDRPFSYGFPLISSVPLWIPCLSVRVISVTVKALILCYWVARLCKIFE